MKKWLVHGFIAAYLGALCWGTISHTMKVGNSAHPAMYYIVWDMFCGWSSYSSRHVIIAEGESGKHYELTPGPWGEFRPAGSAGRQHFDVSGRYFPKFAMHTLQHTTHEPIRRIIVVEEAWAKKFNLPDPLWKERFDEPKRVNKYYHVRQVLGPQGELFREFPSWTDKLYAQSVRSNPRLQYEKGDRRRPMFAGDRRQGNHRQGNIKPVAFSE